LREHHHDGTKRAARQAELRERLAEVNRLAYGKPPVSGRGA
jgi:hypothetical protein